MNKNKNQQKESVPPPRFYKFYLGSRERYIHISCDFESGNIELVRQLSQFHYRLMCVDDGVRTNHRVNSKSWFYFSVVGFPRNTKGKFAVSRVQTLISVYNSSYAKTYRPVYRQCFGNESWSSWNRIQTESPLILRQNGELECVFDFPFKNEEHKVEFAFCYPYTYTENIRYMNSLNEYYCHQQFYFHKQILTQSPEGRDIHLLTITSHDLQDKEHQTEDLFNQNLFPEKCRPNKFNKPVILITARVHPGQTAASYAMKGIIDFLVSNADLRSHLLKKMFLFMIVPMINVDGVYHGNFRMDNYGKNLNRFYINPSIQKQPAVYAIKELASHLAKDNRLAFYFDLHAHNAKKGAFIYGNALNDFVEQVQSQVFCKIFGMNHKGFEEEYCNFSQKQMNSKDRNEDMTKQGCGRVVMYRMANIIHSYSLQCGIISNNSNIVLPQIMNPEFKLGDKGIIQDPTEKEVTGKAPSSAVDQPLFTIQMYENLGKNLLVTVLDVFDKNPYSRIYSSSYKSIDMLRRLTAFEVFHKAERFRMFEKYIYGKVRHINELIKQVLNSKLHYKELHNFYFYDNKQLKTTKWPQNIPGLLRPKCESPGKMRKFRSLNEPKFAYSLSFLNDLRQNKKKIEQSYLLGNGIGQSQHLQLPEEYKILNQSFSSQTEDENGKQIEDDECMLKQLEQKYKEIAQGEEDLQMASSKQLIDTNREFKSENDDQNSECLSPQGQYYSLRFKEIKEIHNLRIMEREDFAGDTHRQIKIVNNDSPSVRVRRLLKQQNLKKTKLSNTQLKEKLGQMIVHHPTLFSTSPINPTNSSNPFNPETQSRIFDEIKNEIKDQLKKNIERKGTLSTNPRSNQSNNIKFTKSNLSQFKSQKQRIKSTNFNFMGISNGKANSDCTVSTLNRSPSKTNQIIGKSQLPAISPHFFIISTSAKGLNKKV